MNACMHMNIYLCTHTRAYMNTYIHTTEQQSNNMHTCILAYIHTYKHAHTQTCILAYIYNTDIYTYMRTYTTLYVYRGPTSMARGGGGAEEPPSPRTQFLAGAQERV